MKHELGINTSDLVEINAILEKFPAVTEAIVFGSRAKGNYKPGSDVDIALKGNALDLSTLLSISYMLNETTMMPYTFDVVNYDTLLSPDLIDHINRVGITILQHPSKRCNVVV